MHIQAFVEPLAGGFRASTARPVALSAEGPSEDAALNALRSLVADRLRAGGHVRALEVPDPPAGQRLADNPLFDDWLKAVERYREERDAEERAAEAADTRAGG